MPELPEVETVRRTLSRLVCGRRIESVDVRLPRIVKRPDDPLLFSALLAGHTFQSVERRGKFLRFVLDGIVLISHLRMEGRYGLYDATDPEESHTHVIFRLDSSKELRYKDVRQFGTMHVFELGEEWMLPPLCKLGVEPLDESFSLAAMRRAIAGRTTKIKPLLLNQEVIVGLGNIYVDEALFRARIHPETNADQLTQAQLKRLHQAVVATLREAVDAGGSTVKSYVNGQGEMGMFQQQLNVYGRKNEPCSSCGTSIVKIVLGGRGTHFCPRCQKKRLE